MTIVFGWVIEWELSLAKNMDENNKLAFEQYMKEQTLQTVLGKYFVREQFWYDYFPLSMWSINPELQRPDRYRIKRSKTKNIQRKLQQMGVLMIKIL